MADPVALPGPSRFDDIERFRRHVSGSLSPHRLHPRSREQFSSRVWGTALGRLAIMQFSNGTDLDVEIPEHRDYFDFVIARSGQATVRPNGHEVDVTPGHRGVILPPGSRVEMKLRHGFDQLHLKITPASLIAAAEALLGRPVGSHIAFTAPDIDLRHGSSAWASAVCGIADDGLHAHAAQPHPLVARQWEETILTVILTSLPNTLSPLLDSAAPPALRRSIDLAVGYIDAHLADPMSVAEIAGVAHVSVRSLQRAFQDQFGQTPGQFIQDRRLAAARQELLVAAPDETVTDVGYRWGFTHLPRFAAAYAKKYGEAPSATLTGARGAATR